MARKEVYQIFAGKSRTVVAHATRFGGLVFVAGTVGRNPETGAFPQGDIREQTRQTLENIKTVLQAAGTSLADVLKVNVYLKDMNDRASFNEVYASFFSKDLPARTTFQAGALLEGLLIEIDVVAGISD